MIYLQDYKSKDLILDFKTLNVNEGIIFNVHDYYEAKFVKNQVRIMTVVNMKLCHLLPLLLLWMVMVCSKAEGNETYNFYTNNNNHNQLEKLEAAKAARLVCLCLRSLTGAFWSLLGPSEFFLGTSGSNFSKPFWLSWPYLILILNYSHQIVSQNLDCGLGFKYFFGTLTSDL